MSGETSSMKATIIGGLIAGLSTIVATLAPMFINLEPEKPKSDDNRTSQERRNEWESKGGSRYGRPGRSGYPSNRTANMSGFDRGASPGPQPETPEIVEEGTAPAPRAPYTGSKGTGSRYSGSKNSGRYGGSSRFSSPDVAKESLTDEDIDAIASPIKRETEVLPGDDEAEETIRAAGYEKSQPKRKR